MRPIRCEVGMYRVSDAMASSRCWVGSSVSGGWDRKIGYRFATSFAEARGVGRQLPVLVSVSHFLNLWLLYDCGLA